MASTAKKTKPKAKAKGKKPHLTAATVRGIRAMAAKGKPQREIGAKYGVSRSCVYACIHRHTYKDIA